jgi:thymidylate kinase
MSRRRKGFLVAVLGADGAGKSTVTELVVKQLPRPDLPLPAVRAYLGDDLPPDIPVLATTRWLRRRWEKSGAPDGAPEAPAETSTSAPGSTSSQGAGTKPPLRQKVAQTVSTLAAMAEELHQSRKALAAARRGNVVFLDRHFYYDYYFHHVAIRPSSMIERLHGKWVAHALPRPSVAICLDAPAELLYERQPERTFEQRVVRRAEYLKMAEQVGLTVIDAARPLDDVVDDVIRIVKAAVESRRA